MSNLCPLHHIAESTNYFECADALDRRLAKIRAESMEKESVQGTPEIRLELDDESNEDNDALPSSNDSNAPRLSTSASTTLHPSKTLKSIGAHPNHISALLRLLLVHSASNPANRSIYVASLLVPLYNVLNRELEPSELAHAEADTFWLFEALVGEVAELEDEDRGTIWMQKLSERLAWADGELASDLVSSSLLRLCSAYRINEL